MKRIERWAEPTLRLETRGVSFLIPPHVRYEGKPNEQASLFVCDPSGNVLEFKAFADPERLLETEG